MKLLSDEPLPEKESGPFSGEQNDPDQFMQLYNRWLSPVYRYAYHFLGNGTDAEDLTSQVFLSVYQALPHYRCNGHFAGWLFTIAHNQALEYLRKRKREVAFENAANIPASVDIAQEVISREEMKHLRELIFRLPIDEQELIRLRYVAGLSFADMGIVLKRNEDAVKKSLYRLQARLQSLMEEYHE